MSLGLAVPVSPSPRAPKSREPVQSPHEGSGSQRTRQPPLRALPAVCRAHQRAPHPPTLSLSASVHLRLCPSSRPAPCLPLLLPTPQWPARLTGGQVTSQEDRPRTRSRDPSSMDPSSDGRPPPRAHPWSSSLLWVQLPPHMPMLDLQPHAQKSGPPFPLDSQLSPWSWPKRRALGFSSSSIPKLFPSLFPGCRTPWGTHPNS